MKLRTALIRLKHHIVSFDTNSLRFKLWAYFVLFAICLMAALWALQTIFLQPYYQQMKKKDILQTSHAIASRYSQTKELDFNVLMEDINSESYANDMFIYLQSLDGSVAMWTTTSSTTPQNPRPFGLLNEEQLRLVLRQIVQSPSGTTTLQTKNDDMMVYGKLIESKYRADAVLCIFAALTPLESTITILANQLVLVTAISLALAFALSIWISRRVTTPIFQITKKAKQLAQGEYGVTFDGGHYSEIKDLADTLTYTSTELAKADNLQKDLIANVSHDLRTPLTMVKSYAEMVRDLSGDNPVKRTAHLQVIIDEADRLNLLVSDMLLISKMQSGVEAMHIDPFDLKEAVVSLMNTYAILEEQEGYHFHFLCEEETLEIRGDENRLKQVVANLINNAVRYGGDAKDITVSLRVVYSDRPGGPAKPGRSVPVKFKAARFSVTDKGPGIAPEELEHIWDRYYKASRTGTRAVSGGSGLGLSIVKEILILHKAAFGVESKLEEGSTFWFELPL